MKDIIGFIKGWTKEVDKLLLAICTVFIAMMIWLNYGFHLEQKLTHTGYLPFPAVTGRLVIFSVAFFIPYALILARKQKPKLQLSPPFIACLVLAPVLFALKAGIPTNFAINEDVQWNNYWNDVLYWPVRSVMMLVVLLICHRFFHRGENLYGLSARKFNPRPYLIMLMVMVPLIAVASTQHDFLASYPKLHKILPLPDTAIPAWIYKALFELSYGTDFFSIELFFRGFLIIGLTKWAGRDVIFPIACFYCTIHFGKPLGECISSYFGGLLLGIVSYHTRSVYGGLMVHLGIAWLMEVGGYIGGSVKW